jgi:hypothetical protein
MVSTPELPNIADLVGPLLQSVAREERPLLIAIAERMAAERYREWAEAVKSDSLRSELRACADREEDIASRVEGLFPDAAATQEKLLANNADLQNVNREIFAGRPLRDQFTIQAQGERVGASTWRAFAEHAEPAARRVFLECAELEEASAVVLEAALSQTPG